MLIMKTLFRETRTTRRIDFRLDNYGIYFLAYQAGDMVAGVSYQFPEWFTKNEYLVPGLSGFSWDAQEVNDFASIATITWSFPMQSAPVMICWQNVVNISP